MFQLNYISLILATLASMVVGFVWYSPILFGSQWMKLMGWDPHDKKLMADMKSKAIMGYLGGLVSSLIMASTLSYFIQTLDVVSLTGVFQLVMLVWLGFIATTLSGSILWEGKPKQLYYINTAYHLVSLIVMALILL